MREEIRELAKMGPLPSQKIAMQPDQSEKLERYALLIVSIRTPVTDEEARVLIGLFGPDDCFEMEETLVHLAGDYMKKLLTLVAVLALAGSALAQTAHKVVRVEDVVWVDHPFFKGAKTAILVGDPTKAEVIVQRVKFPPHYRVPPHTHPYAEIVTVLTGSYGNGFGEKFEPKGELMKPGSLFVLPAKHCHYTWTGDEETILQLQFMGPGGIEFIDPADDPRKK